MHTNLWIETSRKLYAAFLSLYPREHRTEYGSSMLQVFTDQCRSAYTQKGFLSLLALWLRTLPDLGYTALLEHLTSPSATWGLMEPVPNAPLPWKGVFLILLPGLVYLISQIAQLTGQPWYMTVYYRAAFFLIIPVLIVWAITRRFPLWGLIPVGLLYRLVQEIGYQLIVLHPDVFSGKPLLDQILNFAELIQQELWLLITPVVLAILFLVWRYASQQKLSRNFWFWLGIYLLAVLIGLSEEGRAILQNAQQIAPGLPVTQQKFYFEFIAHELYDTASFLLLVFIGTLFTCRHGFFAILLLVGYILPMIVVGMTWYDLESYPVAFIITSTAVLAYRTLLSLLGPIWIARSGSLAGKKRAVLISITLAIGIHALMQIFPWLAYPIFGYQPNYQLSIFNTLLNELKLISGICLGIAMYQEVNPLDTASHEQQPQLSAKKA